MARLKTKENEEGSLRFFCYFFFGTEIITDPILVETASGQFSV